MDDNLSILLIMVFAIAAAVILTVRMAGVRQARRGGRPAAGLATDEAQENARLTHENAQLRSSVGRMEQRLAVLERIATDPAERTAREIESLR